MMCTSLEPSVLAVEEELLAFYHAELTVGLENRFGSLGNSLAAARLDTKNEGAWSTEEEGSLRGVGCMEGRGNFSDDNGGGGGDRRGDGGCSWYPFEQFMNDYRVAFLDYMR